MRLAILGGLAVIAVTVPACVTNPEMYGPMPVRNNHPAQLTVMHMDPADASVLPAGRTTWRTDFAYTSLFLFGNDSVGGSWFMDGELLRGALDARLGLGHGLQLGVQLAGAHTSGGFLDNFVEDYHDTLGLPDQNRSTSEDDRFRVQASVGAATLWQMDESSAEFMDLPIQLTWQLREPGEDRFGVAVRGGVELPIGDQSDGYGNGEIDASIGTLFDYRSNGIGFNGHFQHTFAGTPRQARDTGLKFEDVTSIGLGTELPLDDGFHALVQVEWETSTLRNLGPKTAAREQLLLWVGGRYQTSPEWQVEIGFGEDLRGLASPDFTAWLGIIYRPGA